MTPSSIALSASGWGKSSLGSSLGLVEVVVSETPRVLALEVVADTPTFDAGEKNSADFEV